MKLCWLTTNNFLDVDLPILPEIEKYYQIDWYVIQSKNSTIDYSFLLNDISKHSSVNINFYTIQYRARNPFIIWEYFKVLNKVRKSENDLYYINASGFPYFSFILRVLLDKKKVIIAAHNVKTPKGAANQRLADLYMKFTLWSFTNFQVFSKNQMNILTNKFTKKRIFYAPLLLKNFGEPKIKKNNLITFLNFGIIRGYKRIDVLIEAANKAYEKTDQKFKVIIAGACNQWEQYQKLIKYDFLFDLRIKSIPNEDIPDLFGQSHYFVLPYQDIAQSGAMTVAFNYNLPVLASNLESFQEFIVDKKTGFLFETASVTSLTKLMVYLLQNHHKIYPKLRSEQSNYIRNNYSVQMIAKRYMNYFEGLL